MCRDHERGQVRRCSCCDPEARRAARREKRMRERGCEDEVDAQFAASTVAERASMVEERPEAAFDPSPTVRVSAARGPLTEEAEGVLAGDEKSRVRAALASNPEASPETLDVLSSDENSGVKEAVAKHPATPPETLAGMARELDRRRDLSIARALAHNPRTPSRALAEWLESGTAGWRTLARNALRKRAEMAAGLVLGGTERLGAGMEATAADSAGALDEALGLGAHAGKVA